MSSSQSTYGGYAPCVRTTTRAMCGSARCAWSRAKRHMPTSPPHLSPSPLERMLGVAPAVAPAAVLAVVLAVAQGRTARPVGPNRWRTKCARTAWRRTSPAICFAACAGGAVGGTRRWPPLVPCLRCFDDSAQDPFRSLTNTNSSAAAGGKKKMTPVGLEPTRKLIHYDLNVTP